MPEKQSPPREQFATRIGVIMAVAGSAVGIGNYLRFPGLAAEHGGGAFMLPYFVALLVIGIPLSWAEWTMGRYGGIRGFNSAPGIFSVIWRHPAAKYFGALALMIPLVVYMYYVMIEAWCLSYAISYITGDLITGSGGQIDGVIEAVKAEAADAGAAMTEQQVRAAAFGQFFDHFIGAHKDGAALESSHRFWLGILIGVFILNFACIYRGLSKGIEKLCNIGMPVLFLLSFAVLFRVLTLGTPDPAKPDQNLLNGLGFMWNPSPEALAELKNPKTWLDAAGQIFFTLSVGFGIIINYASYLRRSDDVALSSLSASAMNEFSEVCHGGLITIPAAFIFLGAAGLVGMSSTFHVGFVALPNVFDSMNGGRVFGCMWYFMLFIAAIAASVSMLQPCIAFLEEGFGLKRHASAAMLGLLAAIGCGFVLYFSKRSIALDTFDFWVGTFFMFVLGMFQTFLYGWVFGIERGHKELHDGANIRIPKFVQYVLKYITLAYLVIIFVAFCWFNIPSGTTPKFKIDASVLTDAEDGAPPDGLAAQFEAEETPLPEGATLTAEGDPGNWLIKNEAGLPIFTLAPTGDAEEAEVQVSSYQIGSIEKIWRQPVAFASVGFILVVLGFLLLLARIAGLRWQAAGKFDGLDDPSAAFNQ